MSDDFALEVIELTRIWPFGLDGDNPSEDSLLLSPFRRVASSGGPTGRVTYLFLQTPELPPPLGKGQRITKWWTRFSLTYRHPIFRTVPRLLGCLSYTPGGMLLYFPGYQGAFLHGMDAKTGKPVNRQDDFRTHHFSLEPGFDRWHITALDGARVLRLGVEGHGQDEVFWFGMSLREASDLEAIYRRNRWMFCVPPTDARRRLSDTASACDGAVFQIVECPDARVNDGPSFWHFEFTVTRKSIQGFAKPPLHLPRPPLGHITSRLDRLPIRSHVVRLPSFEGAVIILATRVSGTLSTPILLTHL